jgi:hypothetical protein
VEIFSGHLEQVDYEDDVIRGLHLVDREGVRLLIRLDPPAATHTDVEWMLFTSPRPVRRTGPLVFLARDARPPVTIEREGP